MADEPTPFVSNTDPVVFAPEPEPAPVAEPEPETAKTRLRAFEDEMLGAEATRINGEIEKGHGSHFKVMMTEAQRHHHAALEHLVAAEGKLAHASAHLAQAEADHEKAKADVAASESHVEAKPDGKQPE